MLSYVRSEFNIGFLLSIFVCLTVGKRVSRWAWNLPFHPRLAVQWGQRILLPLIFLFWGYRHRSPHQAFTWMLKIWTQVPVLAQWHFSAQPSPQVLPVIFISNGLIQGLLMSTAVLLSHVVEKLPMFRDETENDTKALIYSSAQTEQATLERSVGRGWSYVHTAGFASVGCKCSRLIGLHRERETRSWTNTVCAMTLVENQTLESVLWSHTETVFVYKALKGNIHNCLVIFLDEMIIPPILFFRYIFIIQCSPKTSTQFLWALKTVPFCHCPSSGIFLETSEASQSAPRLAEMLSDTGVLFAGGRFLLFLQLLLCEQQQSEYSDCINCGD